MTGGYLTPEESAAITAATPEGRRVAWISAGPERTIMASGHDWVACQRGKVVCRLRTRELEKLMDELDRMAGR